ncbi:MAG: ketopantoate reductase family protein [Candidatus Omnitrophota bacterium]|nr:ketopantoate reductase family protein [Candidatus Omnitrophota bacterium]
MRIAVIGAGAIGCLVAGYLKEKGEEVTLVGHGHTVKAIHEHGVAISGARGSFKVPVSIADTLNYIPDLVILTTKTQNIDSALADSAHLIQNSLLLTTQNGVQADKLAAKYLPAEKIISSIVMFGATSLESGKVVHNFEGSWIIGSLFNSHPTESLISLSLVLDKAFPVIISQDMQGMKYLKIFVNANNCLPAIIGKSMQEVFSDLTMSRISIAIWKEAFEVFDKIGIDLVSLPGFPVENLTKFTTMPSAHAAEIFSAMMRNLSKDPLYGSILQSIMRGKLSEIDYINGEFVRLAEENNLQAPLNKILVDMVHQVEANRRFFSKEDLIQKTKELV